MLVSGKSKGRRCSPESGGTQTSVGFRDSVKVYVVAVYPKEKGSSKEKKKISDSCFEMKVRKF